MNARVGPEEYGSEKELIDDYLLEYTMGMTVPLLRGLGGQFDPRWNRNGLFGEIGRHPSCIRTPGLGRPSTDDPSQDRGSRTIYLPTAFGRLHYILTATVYGLGPEKIKTALEFGIPDYALEVCGNDKNIRCILTRPLVLLLNARNLSNLDPHAIYKKIWNPWQTTVSAKARKDEKARASLAPGSDLYAATLNRASFRDRIPLAVFLDQPASAEEYVADLKLPEAQAVVDAMRRIASTDIKNPEKPRDMLDNDDIRLVEHYARPGYEVKIQRCPPDGRLAEAGREHVVYHHEICLDWEWQRRRPWPMTLLQHACSHLRFIIDERDQWVRRCHRGAWNLTPQHEDTRERCPVFFAVYDRDQDPRFCGTSYCKVHFDSDEVAAAPDDE
ncbi:MAG: hypothetical protein ABSF35_15730 [Polyangia bacterium]|jgi:hypothetical protein